MVCILVKLLRIQCCNPAVRGYIHSSPTNRWHTVFPILSSSFVYPQASDSGGGSNCCVLTSSHMMKSRTDISQWRQLALCTASARAYSNGNSNCHSSYRHFTCLTPVSRRDFQWGNSVNYVSSPHENLMLGSHCTYYMHIGSLSCIKLASLAFLVVSIQHLTLLTQIMV